MKRTELGEGIGPNRAHWAPDDMKDLSCPIDDCDGGLEYIGAAWPMSDMGMHHRCGACGVVFAVRESQLARMK